MKMYVKKTVRTEKDFEKEELIENVSYYVFEIATKQYGYVRLVDDDNKLLEEFTRMDIHNKYEFVDERKDQSYAIRYTEYDGELIVRDFSYTIDNMRIDINNLYNRITFSNNNTYNYRVENGELLIEFRSGVVYHDNFKKLKGLNTDTIEKAEKCHKKLVEIISKLKIREGVKNKILEQLQLR